MKKIFFVSLGCARNLVDSEFALNKILESGYELVEETESADLGIVNTCGFIKDAKDESIDIILDLIQLKKEGKLKKIIVGGCLSQRYSRELVKELPQIDAILGINWEDLDSILRELDFMKRIIKVKKVNYLLPYPKYKSTQLTPNHYAYLKISEGCSNNCSYCAIPNFKGRHRSKFLEEIIGEAFLLIQRGVKEINIVAQDTTSYGIDIYGHPKIVELLKEIDSLQGDFWIRLLYTHPTKISEELINCFRDLPKLCKYLDLPLQHINNRILKAMNRKIDKSTIYNLIQKLRTQIRDLCLRTTFIVGFPEESEKEFDELIDFITEIKFERLGCFIYSKEDGTPAYNFKNQVPEKVKKKRYDILMQVQREIASLVNKKFLGKELKVLVDEEDKDYYLARTEYDAPEVDGTVYIQKGKDIKAGDFKLVKIKDTLEYDLLAEHA